MNSYILLRDNKETGPHSAADLQKIGLKANDLIWVECQSVSWRNPGEISELKKLMGDGQVQQAPTPQPEIVQEEVIPVIEEQVVPIQIEELVTPVVEKQVPVINEELVKKEIIAEEIPVNKKSVFVSMPGNKNAQVKAEQKSSPVASSQSINEKYMPPVAGGYTQPVADEEKPLEKKYERSLDDIKEMYVKNLESRKNFSKGFNFKIPKGVKKAAVYIGLILVGAATVMVFRGSDDHGPSIVQDQQSLPVKFKTRPDSLAGTETATDAYINSNEDQSLLNGEDEPSFTNKSSQSLTVQKTEPEINRVDRSRENDDTREPAESGNDDKISIPKNEIAEIKKIPVESISDQLSLRTNSYTIAALGGIRNLELTLQNNSKFHLDKVTVELRYLNPNGNIVKTEDINFKSVDPEATQTIPVKKTNRGVKVTYKIVRVESRANGASTAGL